MGKRYYQQQMLIFGVLILLSVAAFLWQSYSYLYGEYYYPKLLLLAILGFIALTVAIITTTIRYKSGKVLITITQQGIQFYNKPFNACGLILWCDVIAVQELAEGSKGRKFAIFVKDPDVYINAIQSSFKRRSLAKFRKNQGGALVTLQASIFDVDTAELKKFITDSVAAAKPNN
jgi:hypothetical protein